MITRRAWAIIRREYVGRVRTKWFLFTTLLLPAVVVGIAILPALFMEEEDDGEPRVAVVDRAEGRSPLPLVETLRSQEIEGVEVVPSGGELSEQEAAARLAAQEFDAWVLVPPDVFESRGATVLAIGEPSASLQNRLRTAVEEAILLSQLSGRGFGAEEAERLLGRAELQVRDVGGSGRASEAYEGLGFLVGMVLYMMLLIYGQMVTRGVQEEKTSDIVEIIVSSVRPREMMLGKIIGIGGVGLTQVAIWLVMLAGVLAWVLAVSAGALAELGIDPADFRIPVDLAVMTPLYFVLGYLLYAGLFAAAGAMLGSEQDIQQVMLPLVVPLVIPVLILPGVLQTPDAGWAVATSLFPFFTPILMLVRMSVGAVPVWQILASVALLAASIYGAAVVAGRVYRVAILMKGKPPTVPELVRWLRHG